MIDMTIAFIVAAVALAVWLGIKLYFAGERIDSLLVEVKRSREYGDKMANELLRIAKLLKPEPIITPPTDEQHREHKRRWHERQSVDKALKWEDAAKGEQ